MELAEFKKLMKRRDYRESLSAFGRLPYGDQCHLVAEAGDAVREWVERIAADPWLRHWLGPLVRSTVLPKPQTDAYGLGLLQDEEFSFFGHNRGVGNPGVRLSTVLRKHPDVLEDDIWRLFRFGGTRDFSLAGQDSDDTWSWAEAIRELAEAGDIDRGRLLDASLEALTRGSTKFQACPSQKTRFGERREANVRRRGEQEGPGTNAVTHFPHNWVVISWNFCPGWRACGQSVTEVFGDGAGRLE